jgi:hypothetical protein
MSLKSVKPCAVILSSDYGSRLETLTRLNTHGLPFSQAKSLSLRSQWAMFSYPQQQNRACRLIVVNLASAIGDGAKFTGLASFSRKLRASFANGRFG